MRRLSEEKKSLFDIWGDNVKLSDLLIAMLICIVMTLGGYLIAPGDDPQPLIFGLVGGVIGFIISSIIIKPKREIKDIEEES
ncbi:heme ABC transporter [Lentibacillus amyloliquefaciens]|uniref:Heme ABC transporter n=1 Tax=Lentibacillus amyloliquefaciens TaxID=1472767 RepID=A0A0U4EDG5_9BACI|nr:heme ABC transporter [Lentibacillus amyloliquefaciens]